MKVLLSFLVLIFFFTNAQAQEIEATLGGNTSTDGFSVKDNGGNTLFRVEGDGNVGIGTTSPTAKLEISGDNIVNLSVRETSADVQTIVQSFTQYGWIGTLSQHNLVLGAQGNGTIFLNRINNEQWVGILDNTPSYTLDVSGTIGGNGVLYHSDIRWKKNVQSLTNSLDKIKRLRGVNFEWRLDEFAETNFSEGKQVGMIAQEVEEVIPELVNTASDGYKSVDYAKLVSVLIEAMKEQQKQIEDLESRINTIALKELDRESYGYIKTNLNNLKNFYSVMR